jgi:uncharacterized protein
MQMSMYQAAVPTAIHALNNLAVILQKAADHAATKKLDPAVLLNSRLFPDMFALARQVQIAADSAKGGVALLGGVEAPKYEDNETTPAELIARIRKTVAYLETFTPEQLDGSDNKTITWQSRSTSKSMPGELYLMRHMLPNLFFHVTTAYNILRHNGLEIGKKDFLGNP